MKPWWINPVCVKDELLNAPDYEWAYEYGKGFSWRKHWALTEQQWADSLGLGINAASKRGRGKRG